MLTQEDNELVCRTGPGTIMGDLFRRFWLPALLMKDLPEPDCEPVRLKILGENLVAFRDTNGKVGILDRRCPHRLADLWFGRNENAGLTCAYHGWKFDVAGKCVEMPTEPADTTFLQKVKMKTYPTREFGGIVWVYMGPPERMPAQPAQFEWARVPDSHRVVSSWLQDSNYLQATEGEIDSAHVSFNHRWFIQDFIPQTQRGPRNRVSGDGRVMSYIDGAPRLTVKETDYGFVYGSRRQVSEQEYYWRVTQFLLPFFSLIPGPTPPRGGRCWVPVDDEHNMVFQYSAHPERPLTDQERLRLSSSPEALFRTPFKLPDGTIIDTWRPKRNKDNDYLIDREMQRTQNFTGIASGREQDMAMTDGMGAIPERWMEHLGTTDIAIITCRRMLLRLARELRDGKEPIAPQLADAFHVRPIDIVSDEADFLNLYEEHGNMAMAVV
jgi:nitrite reductase/ring-hydroxylating ferredoxin subunit